VGFIKNVDEGLDVYGGVTGFCAGLGGEFLSDYGVVVKRGVFKG
jgi:hypothetical protein